MRFCKYKDLERLVRDYSDGMFSLIFPKLNSNAENWAFEPFDMIWRN